MRSPPCGNYGDIDDDGGVGNFDLVIISKHVLDPIANPLTEEEKRRADVDGDGIVTDADSQLIRQYIIGNIDTFPVCDAPTPPPTPPTFKIGDIVCYTPDQITCTIIAVYASDYKLQRHDTWKMFLSSRIVPGACGESPQPTPPNMETRTMALTEGQHTIQISLSGYDTLNATINVSSTGVTCTDGPCNTTGPPGVVTSGWTVTTYLKEAVVTSSYATWIAGKGGLTNATLPDIFELKDAFIGLTNIGFTPTLPQIMECKDAFIGL
jgi:hypothetical protein